MRSTHTLRTFGTGFAAGALVILLSSSIAISRDRDGIAGNPPPPCPADIAPPGGNGVVDVDDLLMVINAWGNCPQGEDDADGDGWTIGQGDCDDANPDIHPGAVEVCNGIDDDCDGSNDDGVGSPDAHEPNDACIASTDLGSTEGGTTLSFTGTLYPAGDHDFLRFFAAEQNGSFDPFVNATLTLAVPEFSSSSFQLCARFDGCAPSSVECISVEPGTTATLTMEWNDQAFQDDSRHIFIEIRQLAPADGACQPYELTLSSE